MHTPTKLGAAVLSAALLLAIPSQAMAADTNPKGGDNHFDLQAHRGGIGLTAETTLASFAKGIRLGVTTLELDIQITQDGQAVVTHDRRSAARSARHRARHARRPGVPLRRQVRQDLTLAQVRTPRLRQPDAARVPRPAGLPGARMPLLSEVFDLVGRLPREPGEAQRRDQGRGRRPSRPLRASSSCRSRPARSGPPASRAR